jgi:hypothetical protein
MELSTILSIISIIIVLLILGYLIIVQNKIKEELKLKIHGLVEQINNSSYYVYNYDVEQARNIDNNEKNIATLRDTILNINNNLQILQNNVLLKSEVSKNINTQQANINKLQLGNKWSLTNTNDYWLQLYDKDGKDYFGGIAAGNIWSRDNICIGNTCINEAKLKKLIAL